MGQLKTKLIREKPFKVYVINVEVDSHTEELCNFLREHKDKEIEIILNGHKIKFNSEISKKKFIEGFRSASKIIFKHIKEFANETQDNINKLTSELEKTKQDKILLHNKNTDLTNELATNKVVQKLRTLAWEDSIQEWKEVCEVLKTRLDKIEPVIDLIKNATSDGDLNRAHIIAKKEKL